MGIPFKIRSSSSSNSVNSPQAEPLAERIRSLSPLDQRRFFTVLFGNISLAQKEAVGELLRREGANNLEHRDFALPAADDIMDNYQIERLLGGSSESSLPELENLLVSMNYRHGRRLDNLDYEINSVINSLRQVGRRTAYSDNSSLNYSILPS